MSGLSPTLDRKNSLSASVHDTSLTISAPAYSLDKAKVQVQDATKDLRVAGNPLSPITRPLNVNHQVTYLPHTPTGKSPPAALPPSVARFLHQPIAQKKASSPPIGPSPLRNPVVLVTPSSSEIEVESLLDTSRISGWDLSDLVRNGRLDVDAVSEVLGLGFDMSSTPSPQTPSARRNEPGPMHVQRPDASGTDITRRLGGPLCAIPEETDDISDDMDLSMSRNRSLSSLVERWGRVCAKQGGEINPGHDSVSSSILEVDLSLLGIDVSAIRPSSGDGIDEDVEIWEEEYNWTDDPSVR
ncbi:hypothetical protein PHLCEN_2v6884 [Hermanssonia centrifuga]|uniref:Uncharacterized protein n=1 Tax=Hermanssonia centrifuga TaxID=98765 RepID=A0A2R6NYS1_9APHY|nr:hypothetical protein PHLCEN_2v6884 [Hermanssonia centrifuga]